MSEHWQRFQAIWDAILPPLRPAPSAVEAFRAAAPADGRRLLVLGVTPELSDLGRQTTAVDHDRSMIQRVWPGNGPGRQVLQADWRAMPLATNSVEVVYGDGAINVLRFPSEAASVMDELDRVLVPGGKAVFRVYCTPDPPETFEELARAAETGGTENVFALKWRLAMARVGMSRGPNVRVPELLDAFDSVFPDRAALAADTGFSRELIDTVDLWAGSEKTFSFPTLAQSRDLLASGFDEVRVEASGDYPLAERCPLLVCRQSSP